MNNPLNLIFDLLQKGSNPQQIIQSMLSNNQQAQIIMNQVNSSGMSAKDFVMQNAKQRNIDVEPILNALRQFGVNI